MCQVRRGGRVEQSREKRDFSLRRPTHSQERMRKRNSRPAPLEMTGGEGGEELSNNWAQGYGGGVDSRAGSSQNAKTGYFGRNTAKTGMAQEPSIVEQAIVRALRDNLESVKRT